MKILAALATSLILMLPVLPHTAFAKSMADCFPMSPTNDENESESDDSNDNEEKSLKSTITKLAAFLSDNDYSAAFKLMTSAQREDEVFQSVMMAIQMSSQAADFGQPTMAANIEQIVKDYKLDAIELPDIQSAMENEEDMEKIFAKMKKDVLKNVDQSKAQELITDIQDTMNGLVMQFSPVNGDIKNIELSKNTAVVKIEPKLPDGATGQMSGPKFMYSKFVKVNKQWLWDGIDREAMMKEMGSGSDGLPIIKDFKLAGESLDGKSIDIEDYRGKVVLVDFWGPWCKPCVAEFPKLKQIYKQLESRGFAIVSVAVSDEAELEEFFDDKGDFPWKNILDTDGITQELGINMFPTKLIIDKQGNHVASPRGTKQLLKNIGEQLELSDKELDNLNASLRK